MVLEILELTKKFGDISVLNQISFSLAKGDTFSIVGPSGSGKSTLLKVISNRLPLTSGRIIFNQKLLQPIRHKPHSGIIYLSQEPLLFTHLSLEKNISFGLQFKNLFPSEIRNRTEKMIELLGLEEVMHVPVTNLSGGQKQRVALGRAILIEPTLLLLDEPFSALDHITRSDAQQVFQKLSKEYSTSSIIVTHDTKEALLLGNRYARLDKGALKIYSSNKEFIADPSTGASTEIKFWKSVLNEK
jgi:putrescine transport system ATP-binding protein